MEKSRKNNFKLNKNDKILIERERLATIGQLMGGLAHNLNTPLMGSTGQLIIIDRKLDELMDLIDKDTSKEELKDIINEIYKFNENIRYYQYYMSDVINTVKNYVKPGNDNNGYFLIDELYDKVKILTSFEVKKNKITINYKVSDDLKDKKIKGNVTSLVQVLVNCVENSIHAYEGNPGVINIDSYIENKDDKEFIVILVEDFGCGISEKVKKDILNKMVTTKGNKGSGIGMYLSNIIVKSEFDGFMDIEANEGEGTKIVINVPIEN